MIQSKRMSFIDKEILKELKLRVETTDPLYHGLKKLKIRGKDLHALPQVLFTMLELEVLDLSPARESCLDFRLPLVPPSIGKLINLKVLMLDTNELYSVPKEISLLQSLERLSLSNNRLTSLPHGMARLKRLRSLHLANNKFEAFPLEVCDLEALEFLDLSDNLLVSIPADISKLVNLKTLLLNYNKLIELPDSLCELIHMECLWLGKNRLKSLPRDFGNLVNLDWGYRYTSSVLEDNPLINPPIEVCRKGPVKIKQYFEDLEAVRAITTTEFELEELRANETDSELPQSGYDTEPDTPVGDKNNSVSVKITSPSDSDNETKELDT